MALVFDRKIEEEMEENLPSDAISMSLGHSVTPIDNQPVHSPTYKCSSGLPLFGRLARKFELDDASTSSGDEDFSSVQSLNLSPSSVTSKEDSSVSDDDKTSSPRSFVGDVASSVYSVMFLLRVHAARCGPAYTSGTKSFLGYHTELVPEGEGPIAKPKILSNAKSRKAQKRASKGRRDTVVSGCSTRSSLPESAAGSWASQQRARATTEYDDTKVIRAVRSILNKLTIEKFDGLFNQLVASGIRTPDHISMLIGELFEKATTQHHFIPMYAELCVRLARNSQIASAVGNIHDFRRLLLGQCQTVFEQLLEPRSAESLAEEDQVQHKKRALGNIKLIGELLVQGMLSSSLLVECGNMLLESRMECPDALECLAALLMVAGRNFDTKDWQDHDGLEGIFCGMDELTRDKSTPPRVRFLLRDVLDVRSAGWHTSANQSALKAAPMKLEEVREKQALDEQAAAPSKRGTFGQGKLRVEPQRQRKVESHVGSVPSSSLARLSAILAKPSATAWTPSKPRQAEKNVCAKAHQGPSTTKAPSLSNAIVCEKPITPQVDTPPIARQGFQGSRVLAFDLVTFRRELAATLTRLATDRHVPSAVQNIRSLQVPVELQKDQFVDILSRILEEKRGIVRRCELAFAAGLMVSDQSPFEKKACLDGITLFVQDVYKEMCTEVPRLPAIMRSEFVPTMRGVFSASELNAILPEELRIA